MKAASKLRSVLNKKKIKKTIIKKHNDRTLVLCPLKNVYIYKWICASKCDYYLKGKCPREEKKYEITKVYT